MCDRSDAEVLAPLERELDDPVVHDLAARLARSGARNAAATTRARADPRRVLLVAGLASMLAGCVVLSPAVAGAGAIVALIGLVAAAGRRLTS